MNRFTDAEFDSALNMKNDSILPSSGFTASVMYAVQEEAAALPPIPFPWKRALPGLAVYAAVLGILVAACVHGLRTGSSPAIPSFVWHMPQTSVLYQARSASVLWLVLSTLMTVLGIGLTYRLSSSR